jgi:hypothetical protein
MHHKKSQNGGLPANYRYMTASPRPSGTFAASVFQGPEKQRLDRQAKQLKQRKDRQYQERLAMRLNSLNAMKQKPTQSRNQQRQQVATPLRYRDLPWVHTNKSVANRLFLGPEKQRLDRQAKQLKQRKDRQFAERLALYTMKQQGGLANYRFYSAAPTRSSSFASMMIQNPQKQRLQRQANQLKQRKDRQFAERLSLRRNANY